MKVYLKRGFFLVFSSLLLIVFFPVCGGFDLSPSDEIIRFTSFMDVPYVTDEEIKDIENLRKKKNSFIYGMMLTNETFFNEDGEIRGFSAFFCDWLTEMFGISFEPRIYTWSGLMAAMESGEADFTGELTATEDRLKAFLMTSAIAERSIMLQNEETDAVFGEGADVFFEIYPDMASSGVFPLINRPLSLAAKKAELAPIISVVQKALENGGVRHLTELYNLGEQDFLRHKILINLSKEEKEFIQKNPIIPLAAEFDNYPISFFNARTNEWQGIAIEVIKEMELLTGLKFEIINSKNAQWAELLDLLESGKASIISELIFTEGRDGRFLWPENSVFTDYPALLSKSDMRNVKLNEVFFLNIGLVDEHGQGDMFRSWFPGHMNIITYPNTLAAFSALEKREIDLLMSSQSRLLMYTHWHEHVDYKVNIIFDISFNSTFGFNKNADILCSIVDKSLGFINTKRITDNWLYKTYNYQRKVAEARMPLLIGLSLLSLCILTLIFVLLQRTRHEGKLLEELVQQRTRELYISRQDLEAALSRAQSASQAKSAFLANMSHEIRTPMNGIIGFSELAIDGETSPKTKEYLSKIKTNTEWLVQIIDNILDISKIESGNMELEKIPFDIYELLSSCRTIITPAAAEKDLKLNFDIDSVINLMLMGDPARLRQIFVNLLSNAVKYTNNGWIELAARTVKETGEKITMYFEVSDSGIGVTGELVKKIFEPFEQGEAGITRQFGGTGLGLPIVKNNVDMMGGTLCVESFPETGSKFSFHLTFDIADKPEDEKTEKNNFFDDTNKPFFRGEVLVCEDNVMNQQVICEHLARVGLTAVVADNGKIGVEMVYDRIKNKKEQFCLIFMDIHMPVMDGLEASAKIFEMNKDIPIIAMTANVMSDDREIYRNNGLHDCIGKPFTSRELWKCLLKHLEPVRPDKDTLHEPEVSSEKDMEFQRSLEKIFVKSSRNIFEEIFNAVNSGDIKLAHRLAHTLKSNAGQLGKTNLQKAAFDVESHLKDGKNLVTQKEMEILNEELKSVLAQLDEVLILNCKPEQEVGSQDFLDAKSALELLDKLEKMLKMGNPECCDLIDSIRRIQGSDKLVQQIEDFDFEPASVTLAGLKKGLE